MDHHLPLLNDQIQELILSVLPHHQIKFNAQCIEIFEPSPELAENMRLAIHSGYHTRVIVANRFGIVAGKILVKDEGDDSGRDVLVVWYSDLKYPLPQL